jgi:two-component system nitrate/nitrite response regulator NarL
MKVLVVDDHSIVRQGLAALLRQEGADTQVIHAADSSEGLAMIEAHADLDAVLLDLNMPGGDGMTSIVEFGRRRPTLPVIILSSSEDPGDVRQALNLGALGYVPKSASPEVLISAVRLVLSGAIYVPPLVLDNPLPAEAAVAAGERGALTPRQVEVLQQLAKGHSNKEIGLMFNLSEKTVKAHVGAIFRGLNVVNRTQAANAARAANLIPQ